MQNADFAKSGDTLGSDGMRGKLSHADAMTTDSKKTDFFSDGEAQNKLCDLARDVNNKIEFGYFELRVGDVYIIPPG